MNELIQIADETQRLLETTRALSEQSATLTHTSQELQRANEQLRLLDSRKDEFLSQVSHELRTPMTSIRSFSEILLSASDIAPDERNRFLAIINEESQRLTRLLDEILDISRLESGQVSVELCPIAANKLVNSTLDTLTSLLHTHQVAVHSTVPEPSPIVMGNEDRVRQILINLLANAVKYNTAANPEIRIRVHTGESSVYFDVTDNGTGIEQKDAERVFEKFTRGMADDNGEGAGLGLPISRALARMLGGDLSLDHQNEPQGIFRLRLPAARQALP